MLRTLSIRDILLIERLDLSFVSGLGVLTGETGSGKSILLDALSMAIGARADNELIRQGADQGIITAEFEILDTSSINNTLSEYGITVAQNFILRRLISTHGPSRAFIDDQAVSIALLRQIGSHLVEIHGQLESHGLLDPTTHRGFVDSYGGYKDLLILVNDAFKVWRMAEYDYEEAEKNIEKATKEEKFLKHSIEELTELDPKPDEELELADNRNFLMNAEKSIESLKEVFRELENANGIDATLRSVIQKVQRIADNGGDKFDDALASLDRALIETNEGISELERLSSVITLDPMELERIEQRLFKLRGLARKHNVEVEKLPMFLSEMQEQLSILNNSASNLDVLRKGVERAKTDYIEVAGTLSKERKKAIKKLDMAVTVELAPLKLDGASFHTEILVLEEGDWNEFGMEHIAFKVKTNPNTEMGPIQKIASGGELARITLALKVVLANAYAVPTVIFDEVDSGIGGAAAAAVGERLGCLAKKSQVLVVTHSPQVAARGNTHFQISKISKKEGNITHVDELSGSIRTEEIARMLSGTNITKEARAAAESLLKSNDWIDTAQ